MLALEQCGVPVRLFEKDASLDVRKQGYALTMQQATTQLTALEIAQEVLSSSMSVI
jgi:hypothetical protein